MVTIDEMSPRTPARTLRLPRLLALVAAGGLVASACSGGGKGASTTTSTLPPLPPTVIALVALAGTTVGTGHSVVPVTLTGGTGAQQVGSAIGVGRFPDAIAVNRSGTMAYVANYASNTVTPIDLRTDTALAPIHAGSGPSAIAIAPDGKTAYVADAGSGGTLGDTVTPIDLATNKPGSPITVGPGPQGIVVSPDGKTAYVADAGAIIAGQSGAVGNTVTPIDLATKKALHPITVGNAPLGVAISPDGSTVFVTNLNSESVTPISTATGVAGSAIGVEGGPVAVVISGGTAFVLDTPSSSYPGDNVTPISLATDTAGPAIAVGKGAQDLALAPGGKTLWVSCLTASSIEPISISGRRVGRPVKVTGGPFALAIVSEQQGGTGGTHIGKKTPRKKKKSS